MMLTPQILPVCVFSCALLLGGSSAPAQDAPAPTPEPQVPGTVDLEQAFSEQGIQLHTQGLRCSFPVNVCVRQDLLEYVLVTETGAAHESLLSTSVSPSILNAALMILGAKKGENVRWIERDPKPTRDEIRNGARTHDVLPPTGEQFFMYLAWQEKGETYFFRLEDLITNLERGRSMQRHGWVYLGSRLIQARPDDPTEVLAAEVEGNLINLSYFRAGNTLFSAALEDCVYQTIWAPNSPLVPPMGSALTMILSRKKLNSLPEELTASLGEIAPEPPGPEPGKPGPDPGK